MKSLLRTKISPIGLDLGVRQIKAIQIATRGQTRSLLAAAVIDRKDPASPEIDLDRLKLALERQGFVGNEVAVACPPALVHTDILELPPQSSGAPLDQIARIEMQRSFKLDTPFEIALWNLPSSARSGNTATVMATTVKHSDSELLLNQLERIGLEVALIDTQATALANIFVTVAPDQITAVVDTGASASALILISAGKVIYQRRLPEISFDLLRRSVTAALDLGEPEQDYLFREIGVMDSENEKREVIAQEVRLRNFLALHLDALADEIEASLTYAAHRYPKLHASQVVVIGGGGWIAGIERYLGQRLSIEVTIGRPANYLSFQPGQAARALSPTFLSAMGLAMNEVD